MSNISAPKEWIVVSIADVTIKGLQKKPNNDEHFIYVDIGSIDRTRKIIVSPQNLVGINAPSRARKIINKGDVLVSLTRPNLNAVALIQAEYDKQIASTGFEVIKPILVESRYIFALVRSDNFIASISGKVQGALYPAAKSTDVKAYQFPLPPLAEQKEIATRLDHLLAQVDTLKTRLDAIPILLKRFRQSVLAAAVSGKLTEDWREDDEYTQVEIMGLSIPKYWQILTIADIAEVKGGKRLPKGEKLVSEKTDFPYIRAGQLKNGTILQNNQLFLQPYVQSQIARYIINTDDVYITIVGACIGDAGIVPAQYNGANLTENAAKLCLFKKDIESRFLSHWMRSYYIQQVIQKQIKSGTQGKLALKRIKKLPFPYPAIEEQTEIVTRVETLFTFADKIEQHIKQAQNKVNQLTPSLLAKAFRGELTADWREQHPELISGENSAKALLERIQAEREKLKPTSKKRARKAKKT